MCDGIIWGCKSSHGTFDEERRNRETGVDFAAFQPTSGLWTLRMIELMSILSVQAVS